jgi:hypothetical protein
LATADHPVGTPKARPGGTGDFAAFPLSCTAIDPIMCLRLGYLACLVLRISMHGCALSPGTMRNGADPAHRMALPALRGRVGIGAVHALDPEFRALPAGLPCRAALPMPEDKPRDDGPTLTFLAGHMRAQN